MARPSAWLLSAAIAVLALALPAAAHEGHEALPEGFQAEITGLSTAEGDPVELAEITFGIAADGVTVTASNTGASVLEVAGEQAGEPLVRVTATEADVNEASPQAADVEGANVDPAAAAPLVDLVWGRVEPTWVALPAGGSVTFMDHRAAPGHPPVRAEHRSGDVVAEWRIAFTLDDEPYRVNGRNVAVGEDGDGSPWLVGLAGLGAVAAALAVGVRLKM